MAVYKDKRYSVEELAPQSEHFHFAELGFQFAMIDRTKSAAGDREVPLSDLLVQEIRKHRLASKFGKDDDYVFANAKGRHICHDNLMKRHYKPLLNEANISGVNWHSLRHFAISTWIEQGLQPKTIQTYAGHSSLAVTMDRYGHLFPSEDHKTAMDAIAGELLG